MLVERRTPSRRRGCMSCQGVTANRIRMDDGPKAGAVYPEPPNLDGTARFRWRRVGGQTWDGVVWVQEAIVPRKLL